jgi:signal transduction histidine kinase
LKNEEGEPYGFSKITRDVTDRKQLMDRIKEHAEDLEAEVRERERINADLEAFSYSVSHDLRAPLRTIEGFAVALGEDYGERLDAKGHEYLKEISDAAVRMNRLVQDLLEYSRVSRGEMVLEPVQVGAAAAGALKELAEPKANVQVKIPPNVAVRAHPNTLVHVLFNLISNGLKFHAPGVQPRVEIQIGPGENGFSRISVTDNGIGIAPQHHARIFQVFERLHGPETYPGTGIGLAIVKRGIERMGGRYGLTSQVGKGSTFWIELPAANGKE